MTFAGFFASAYGGSTLSEPLSVLLLHRRGACRRAPPGRSRSSGVTAFISYLSLVLGELVPKRLCAPARSRAFALFVAPVLDLSSRWITRAGRLAPLGVDPKCRRPDARPGPRVPAAKTSRRRSCATWSARTGSWAPRSAGCSPTCSAPRDRQLSSVMVPRTEVEFLAASTSSLHEAARHGGARQSRTRATP